MLGLYREVVEALGAWGTERDAPWSTVLLPALLHGLYLGFLPPDVLTLMHRSCSLTVVFRLGDAFVMWGLLCLSGGAEEAGELGREEPTPRASGAA